MTHRFVRSLADVSAYHPANHTGTTNQRLISAETVGPVRSSSARTIEPGEGASRHAHPASSKSATSSTARQKSRSVASGGSVPGIAVSSLRKRCTV